MFSWQNSSDIAKRTLVLVGLLLVNLGFYVRHIDGSLNVHFLFCYLREMFSDYQRLFVESWRTYVRFMDHISWFLKMCLNFEGFTKVLSEALQHMSRLFVES